jgi:hypothetical protein
VGVTDYDFRNGNITMRIRDVDQQVVELWVLTDRATYNHDQLFSYQVNGVDSPRIKFDMNNRGSWQYITTITPNYRQNVRFTMYGAGIGFNTADFWQWIERARVPDPPGAPYFGEVTTTTIHTAFDYGYDGGMGIDDAEIWYSDDPNVPSGWSRVETPSSVDWRPRHLVLFLGQGSQPAGLVWTQRSQSAVNGS